MKNPCNEIELGKYRVYVKDVQDKFEGWIKNRQGISVWQDLNLSRMGGSIFTPNLNEMGAPYSTPKWGYTKVDVVYNIDKFEFAKEFIVFKEFKIATRISGNGLMIKLTDGSSNKLNKWLDKAKEQYGVDAVYHFDYEARTCIVEVPIF